MGLHESPSIGTSACPRCRYPLVDVQLRVCCPECGLHTPDRVQSLDCRTGAIAAGLLAVGVAVQLGIVWSLERFGGTWLNSDRASDQRTWLWLAIASACLIPAAILLAVVVRVRSRIWARPSATAAPVIAVLVAVMAATMGVLNASFVQSAWWVPRWWSAWLQSWPGMAMARGASFATLAVAATLVWQIARRSPSGSTRQTARAVLLIGLVLGLAVLLETAVLRLDAGRMRREATLTSIVRVTAWIRDQRPFLAAMVALGAAYVAASRWRDARRRACSAAP